MAQSKIIYQENQEVLGKHLQSKNYILYSGTLTIYERKTNPVILELKCIEYDSFMRMILEDYLEFKANTVTDVYGKLSKSFFNKGIIFLR